jgi:hypothetical protein
VTALDRDGAVIAEDWISEELANRVAAELRPHFDSCSDAQPSDSEICNTLKLDSVLKYSVATADLVEHAQLLEVTDAMLLPYCQSYRLGSLTGVKILPGEISQELRGSDYIYPVSMIGFPLQIRVIWALDDITLENGGVQVAVGSHRRRDPLHEGVDITAEQVIMDKGSALVLLGSTLYGSGANNTDKPRMELTKTYALGWLRQQENQYTRIPRQIAESYSDRVQAIMGYAKHGDELGWY